MLAVFANRVVAGTHQLICLPAQGDLQDQSSRALTAHVESKPSHLAWYRGPGSPSCRIQPSPEPSIVVPSQGNTMAVTHTMSLVAGSPQREAMQATRPSPSGQCPQVDACLGKSSVHAATALPCSRAAGQMPCLPRPFLPRQGSRKAGTRQQPTCKAVVCLLHLLRLAQRGHRCLCAIKIELREERKG